MHIYLQTYVTRTDHWLGYQPVSLEFLEGKHYRNILSLQQRWSRVLVYVQLFAEAEEYYPVFSPLGLTAAKCSDGEGSKIFYLQPVNCPSMFVIDFEYY